MSSTRSKQIFALLNNNNEDISNENDAEINGFYKEKSTKKTEEHLTRTSEKQCSSPLPPKAEAILCQQKMREVWDDVFSDNNCQEESSLAITVSNYQDESVAAAFVINPPVSSASVASPNKVSPRVSLLNINGSQIAKQIYPCEDPYMPTDAMTPVSVIDCPQSVSSLLHQNIDSPMPLTPIFNYLPNQPSPTTQNAEDSDQSAIPNTPVASPVNRHANCDDPFCCQHQTDEFQCPSVDTIVADSNQPSPAPPALIRNRGKKRPRNHEEWGDVKRKKLKNQGKVHCSKRGRTVEAKVMGPPCRCRFKCATKISNEERTATFNKFWGLGDREKHWLYVANYTKKQKKSRTFSRELKHNREYTYKYFLPKIDPENATHDKIDVCKTMFLNTLGISERMTRTAWQKYDGSTSVQQDMRGRHSHHRKVVDDEMLLSVCAHVKSFVPVESHYCRKSSKRLYLDGSLSVARMFCMYKEWPNLENYTNKATTLRQYRDIVNSQFNLTFHIPKKDTCDQCHIFKNTENPSEQLRTDYEKHQANKAIARHLKNNDKTDASLSDGTILCATFDFQKVLTCPHGQISVLYYKRKLSCYNFTIYDMTTKEGYCYVWDESVARRGANEVSSCLYNFIKDFSAKGVKDFRFWSDNCAGQNRNRIVFAMYTHAAKEFGVTITHRFLEKGHTQNEGDSVHSVIERAGEHKLIYTPDEWKLLIRWAKTEKPYEVREVTKEQVYDFKELLKNKNWTKNTVNEKMTWNKIKEVMVEENQPTKIRYKYSLADDYMTLVIRKETRNRSTIELKNAYFEPVAISNDKFKDLINLCETGIIPTKYHEYFNALPHGRAVSNETDNDSE